MALLPATFFQRISETLWNVGESVQKINRKHSARTVSRGGGNRPGLISQVYINNVLLWSNFYGNPGNRYLFYNNKAQYVSRIGELITTLQSAQKTYAERRTKLELDEIYGLMESSLVSLKRVKKQLLTFEVPKTMRTGEEIDGNLLLGLNLTTDHEYS